MQVQWLNDRSLGVKLGGTVALILVIAFGLLDAISLSQLRTLNIANGEASAKETNALVAKRFQAELQAVGANLDVLQTIVLDSSRNNAYTRDELVRVLSEYLAGSRNALGIFTVWEPNAYDGEDAAYRSEQFLHSSTSGQLAVYITRDSEDNSLDVAPMNDYMIAGGGDYYLLPKSTLQPAWLEPYEYTVRGQKVAITTLVMPLLASDGAFLGVIGIDLALSDLQGIIVRAQPEHGYSTVISAGGAYVAHGRHPEQAMKPFAASDGDKQVWERLSNGELEQYKADEAGAEQLYMFAPVEIGGFETKWYIQTAISKAVILKGYYAEMKSFLTISVAALLAIGGVIGLVLFFMIRQIRGINRLSLQLAEGDFRERLDVRSKDELGAMSGYLNQMIGNLRLMISKVAEHTFSVGATSEQLAASAEQTSQAAESIASSIERVAAGAEAQRNDAGGAARIMAEMSKSANRIAGSASGVAESAQAASATTRSGHAQIQLAVERMGYAADAVDATTAVIERLNGSAQEIGRFVALIGNLSKQTNILALNATIEASRAGEQGRGFSVIANEIRLLAEQSRLAASEIEGLVGMIQAGSGDAVRSMREGSAGVASGVATVQEGGQLFNMILEEMDAVTAQISEVSAAAEQMSASAEQVSATVQHLESIAEESAGTAANVAAATEEQLATMEEISSATAAMSGMVQELIELVGKFRT